MSPLRRLFTLTSTVLCLLGLSASLAACSDDKKDKDDKTTTTEASKDDEKAGAGEDGTDSTDSTEPTETTEETPPVTVSDQEFTEALKPATDALNAAQGPCDVVNSVALLNTMPDPTGDGQNRQAVEFLVLIVQKAADTTTDPAEAESLRSSAQALSDYAESVNYSTEELDIAGEGPDIPEWDALNESMTAYFDTHAQECAPTGATDGSGSAPEAP